jgi:hypothetical protein
MSKRKYHKSNCDATVRAIVEDALGRKVILVGKQLSSGLSFSKKKEN